MLILPQDRRAATPGFDRRLVPFALLWQDPVVRVLIAPDKFKGTLTASGAAQAMARGWRRARPEDELTLLPISDGGDGFGALFARQMGARSVRSVVTDAAGRRVRAQWWWQADRRTAIIESARVVGLAMLPAGKFHPFQLDTRGLGALLRKAKKKGARRCVIGLGGSATNDGGFGLARGLGWKFLDRAGTSIERWTGLHRLQRIEPPPQKDWPGRIIVALDVQNTLLGPRGCTRVYGPQKGLRPREFARAEAALRRLAMVTQRRTGRNCSQWAGAGAAGGLGFGLAAFLGAKLTPGFAFVARQLRLAAAVRRADLVVTGEGRLDRSSLMGKGVGELASLCVANQIPCAAVAGVLADQSRLGRRFCALAALTDWVAPQRALAHPAPWLERASRFVAGRITAQLPWLAETLNGSTLPHEPGRSRR